MRTTSTNRKTNWKKNRAIQLAVSALAVSATLTGAGALADHKGYNQSPHDNSAHNKRGYRQDNHRHGPVYWNHQEKVRVRIPVRDHGPETLPLGRLIRQNSNIDLDRYRLVAVVTNNGRFSNGYASLRTGHSKTQRYFLGARENTWIPAPSRADRKWRLRLGPGTRVRSLTAVLEPRRHGWAYGGSVNAHYKSPSAHDHRKQARRLNKLRAERTPSRTELAETARPGKRGRVEDRRVRHRDGERMTEQEVKRTVRRVISAS